MQAPSFRHLRILLAVTRRCNSKNARMLLRIPSRKESPACWCTNVPHKLSTFLPIQELMQMDVTREQRLARNLPGCSSAQSSSQYAFQELPSWRRAQAASRAGAFPPCTKNQPSIPTRQPFLFSLSSAENLHLENGGTVMVLPLPLHDSRSLGRPPSAPVAFFFGAITASRGRKSSAQYASGDPKSSGCNYWHSQLSGSLTSAWLYRLLHGRAWYQDQMWS